MTASDVSRALRQVATPKKAKASAWFFKSGPGQYAEGDKFLGVTVPEQRTIAKKFQSLLLKDVEKLVMSPWHEERLTGLIILVGQYKRADESGQKEIYDFYLSHTKYINNWDLVDLSAEHIVGPWLDGRSEKMAVLRKLAGSDWLWDRRIAMLATFDYIKRNKADEALQIAEQLLPDKHDLIQKAVGWMLREIGKKVNRQILINFLDKHAATMPRTSLRYAIEHFDPELKMHYMGLAKTKR
ncbi:DNA alkylation repair protein [Candidatus Saccharibacteria bacterium]|nr:DNA alkylation repair protein [Candidatus Saccharibacteria bacterium]